MANIFPKMFVIRHATYVSDLSTGLVGPPSNDRFSVPQCPSLTSRKSELMTQRPTK